VLAPLLDDPLISEVVVVVDGDRRLVGTEEGRHFAVRVAEHGATVRMRGACSLLGLRLE